MVACSMKDEIRIKWCLPENSEEVLKVSHSLKTSGFWNVAVGLVFYVFPILLVFCIMGHSFRISSALVAVLCSTAVGSVPLAYGLFLIRAAHTLLTTEEIREVRKIAVIVGYCPLSLMWGGVLGGRLLAIIANDKTCIDRFVMKTCIINLLILWIIFAVLSFIYGVFSSAPSVCEVVAYVLGEDASERSFERQTIASKPSSKMGRVRRITSQRSFVRHDDARRIVAGREMAR